MNDTIAQIRSAQLVTTFGIGSIVDAPECSIMIAGQDEWRSDRTDVIHEPRLQRRLGVSEFRLPKVCRRVSSGGHQEPAVPAVRFPLWHFCPGCHRLAELRDFGGTKETICRACSATGAEQQLVPARFIVACDQGHIADFPWHWWVHRGATCLKAELEIRASGRSTTLGSIIVRCRTCDLERTMEGVFDPVEIVQVRCPGHRPWLRDRVTCGNQLRVLQRGASNVYFAHTESAVSIPPFSSLSAKIVEKYWTGLTLSDDPEDSRGLLKSIAKKEKADSDDLWTAFNARLKYGTSGPTPDLRLDEYQVLSSPPSMNDKDDFAAEKVAVPAMHPWLDCVVLVHRLRVVTALSGFTRLQAAGGQMAELSRGPQDWFPAMEVHGEGVFLRPSGDALREWKRRAGSALDRRVALLETRRQRLLNSGLRTREAPISAEFLLLHTLSHLLMRALTLECGYSSAALREIVYVREATKESGAMNGLLIYTASADSEGSLGGLVRQGHPSRLGPVLSEAIESARWCSNDPLCLESESQGMNSLNLSACHSCALVPETACETYNGFLDRGVLVGTEGEPTLAFIT